jgi:hypothetical protein
LTNSKQDRTSLNMEEEEYENGDEEVLELS